MRIGVVLVGFCAIVGSIYFVTWLLHEQPKSKQELMEEIKAKSIPVDDDLTPAREGAQPVAVFDQTEFEFGNMEVGEERSHEFTIRNEGEAPLKIKQGRTECKCTISDLDKLKEIPAGGSATVTLTWKPVAEAESFVKGAEVLTNDPQRPSIVLRIQGHVLATLMAAPEGDWHFPEVAESGETPLQHIIGSPVHESFNVVEIVCANPAVKAEAVPLSKIEALQSRLKSGYAIQVRLQPLLPVGVFRIPLTIKTDLPRDEESNAEITVYLSGNRRGPLRIMGREWVEEQSSLLLGNFSAQEGKKVKLLLIVPQDPPGGLQFSEMERDPPELNVALERDETYKGAGGKRYHLLVAYPAKSPRTLRGEFNPGRIKLNTNHPQAPTLQLSVFFNAH
ncbi:MAG: DUF1573 domain-containing protein [Planctomycetaceae bacterium]